MDSKKFFYEFGRALYRVDSFYDEFAKGCNVSPALLWILYALNDGKQHTQIEICNDWELPRTTVNTVVKDLEHKEYVRLVPIKGKRREMLIELTDEGKSYADGTLSGLYDQERAVYESLSAEEIRVPDTLEKIAERLRGKL